MFRNFISKDTSTVQINEFKMLAYRLYLSPFDLQYFYNSILKDNHIWAVNLVFRSDCVLVNESELEELKDYLELLDITYYTEEQIYKIKQVTI